MSDPVRVAIAVAAGLSLLLAWWIAARRRSARALLREAISDPDPGVRRAALSLVGQRGLGEHADLLLGLAQRDQDPSVLRELATVVARNQWEPASDPRLIELRLWSQRYLDLRRSSASDGDGRAARPASSSVAPTVLVTGAGGPAGVSVIRALRDHGVRVVAADADELAAGLRLADDAGILPPADDPVFVDRLCDLAGRTRADALVSTVTEEMGILSRARHELAAAGLATWLADAEALETCRDKWRFAECLRESGIPSPLTRLGSGDGVPGPWIVKPRFGRGSRDVYAVDDPDELDWALARVPEPLVQTRMRGLEFTVDALLDRDGRLAGAVPRWRLETKAGISTKGRTFRDAALLEAVEAVGRAAGLEGPANVQGFLLADGGDFAFVEANPRFSGGLPLSLKAGGDLVGEYLRGIIGLPIRREALAYRSGVTMTRYFEDVCEG